MSNYLHSHRISKSLVRLFRKVGFYNNPFFSYYERRRVDGMYRIWSHRDGRLSIAFYGTGREVKVTYSYEPSMSTVYEKVFKGRGWEQEREEFVWNHMKAYETSWKQYRRMSWEKLQRVEGPTKNIPLALYNHKMSEFPKVYRDRELRYLVEDVEDGKLYEVPPKIAFTLRNRGMPVSYEAYVWNYTWN